MSHVEINSSRYESHAVGRPRISSFHKESNGILLDDLAINVEADMLTEPEDKEQFPVDYNLESADTRKEVQALFTPKHDAGEPNAVPDSVGIYLAEITRYRLLTQEEQADFFRHYDDMRHQEQSIMVLLENSRQNGNEALVRDQLKSVQSRKKEIGDTIAHHNLRLPFSIAQSFTGRGLPLLELVQEGNIGLLEAIKRFEPAKGFVFSTYATWWIRHFILNAIRDKGHVVRLSKWASIRLGKVNQTEQELMNENSAHPTIGDISRRMGIPVENAQFILERSRQTISLNSVLSPDENQHERIEFIPDPKATEEMERVEDRESNRRDLTRTIINNADIARSNPRGIFVLFMRNGFYSEGKVTLEQVGEILGVTRERVRQIEKEIIEKLHKAKNNDIGDGMIDNFNWPLFLEQIKDIALDNNADDDKKLDFDQLTKPQNKYISNQYNPYSMEPPQINRFLQYEIESSCEFNDFEKKISLCHKKGDIGNELRQKIKSELSPLERMVLMLHLQPNADTGKILNFKEIDEYLDNRIQIPSTRIYHNAMVKLYLVDGKTV